jgi:DNA-3-methyladenine glycosylase I
MRNLYFKKYSQMHCFGLKVIQNYRLGNYMARVFKGLDGQKRCFWCASSKDYMDYHDKEWGYPVKDDFKLFEKLSLEGFQAGLSWRTILMKRENFRKVFYNFDFNKIASMTAKDVNRLLKDPGIVRHKGKIEAVINNAKLAQKMLKEEGSLASYFWSFEPQNSKKTRAQLPTHSPTSLLLSKELKKKGWKFVGPTTLYAFMQAMGLINDHFGTCSSYKKVQAARLKFKKPSL